MNHITITEYKDFDSILEKPLVITRSSCITSKLDHPNTSKLGYPDMWSLSFDADFFKTLTQEKILQFFKDLIDKRIEQLQNSAFKDPLTFYLWFDEQALQLRFNIITGEDARLPFGCTVNKVGSIEPILNKFFSIINDFLEGKDFFEVYDVQDIEDIDDDESPENYVLDVYVQTLYSQNYIQ